MNTNAALYGKGVFTTIAIYDGEPFLWDKHWQRLKDHADIIGLDISGYSELEILSLINERIGNEDLINGRARITFIDGSQSSIWTSEPKKVTEFSILTAKTRPLPDRFKLSLSPYRTNSSSPLAGIKSCNYLENILAFDEAKARGFDEAVRLNERGEITGGCMSNIFWLIGERLFTPDLSTGCLAGTTRGFVLENLECAEVCASFDELKNADAVFLTSAGIGIKTVERLDNKIFDKLEHPILDLLPE